MNKLDAILIFAFGFSIALITIGIIDYFEIYQLLKPITCEVSNYCISEVHLFR